MGVPRCEAHAREQKARFSLREVAEACGTVADWEKQVRCRENGPLLEFLGTAQQELDRRIAKQRDRLRA